MNLPQSTLQLDLNQLQSVIFDFDGTLAPNLDLPEMRRQVLALSIQAGVPAQVTNELYIIEIIEASHDWLAANGRDHAATFHQQAHQHITHFELSAAARLDPFPEVRDLLTTLRSAGVKTAVVTRNCEQAVRNTFADIDEYLDLLLARDSVEHCKPDPRHLQAALDGLGVQPAGSLMIGDGSMDMRLGRELQLGCIGVLTGNQNREALIADGAHLVLDHIRDLQPLLVA